MQMKSKHSTENKIQKVKPQKRHLVRLKNRMGYQEANNQKKRSKLMKPLRDRKLADNLGNTNTQIVKVKKSQLEKIIPQNMAKEEREIKDRTIMQAKLGRN